MKYRIHIATKEYCFIELEGEIEKMDEVVDAHDRLALLINNKDGLNASEWKKVRTTMLNTGEFDPNLSESLSKAQRYWVNETKKTLRDIKGEE